MPLHKEEHVYRSYLASFKNFPAYRQLKSNRYWLRVNQVIEENARLEASSDDELRQLADGCHQEAINGRPLELLLPRVFALVRETSRRVLGMTHYPVQILGGIALHHGHIVEMATGEGKTLAATMPAVLNALTDQGVHIITVNDYLARRDAEEMGKIYTFLGLTVGVVTHDKTPPQRMAAYRSSITYVTNKELGFDFLRDELRRRPGGWFEFGAGLEQLRVRQVQRPGFHYAIVDEADSILIDEARTPLIIANAPPEDPEVVFEYMSADKASAELVEDVHYTFERAEKRIEWLEDGERLITHLLGGVRSESGHRIDWHEACLRGLKARVLFHRDVDYVVENGEVIIVDESTGRKMPGRQWEEGLHQAVAAKEVLEIKGQNETLARTTYQILFNRYEKLAGMTGTVMTDALEIAQVYKVGTVKVPTNRPCIRRSPPDLIFGTEAQKWNAVVATIQEQLAAGRPVLVGTRSIEKSELLSGMLREAGVEHVVLNARFEAEEAAIIAEAGKPGRVTVATNMAGRGTDIKLDLEVAQAGGLHVLGTERHESRRIDNQLIGRSARQGDPGSCQFILSVEDPLIRRYRPRTSRRLARKYARGSASISGSGIRRFVRRVQLSIERQHRKIRNQLIKYDRERIKYNKQLGTQ